MVEEKSDMAKAWAVLARSLHIKSPKHTLPVGGDEVIGHIGEEVLWDHELLEKTYEDNTQRHVAIGHSDKGDTLLVQHRKIVLARDKRRKRSNTCRSGSCAWAGEGTWKGVPG